MAITYEHCNEYEVDCGPYGKITVSAQSHAKARYLAYVDFIEAYGRWHYDELYNELPNTLIWFSSISKVHMTIKSVLNGG